MDPVDLNAAVSRLSRRVAFPIDRIVVFGSRARGDGRPDSDVDLLVVSASFEGKSVSARAGPLHLAWDLDLPVDFLCYTPAEFAHYASRVSLVSEALRDGRELALT